MVKANEKDSQAPSSLFSQHNKHAKNEDEWLMIMDGGHHDHDIDSYTTWSSNSTDDGDDGTECSSSDDDQEVDIDYDASSKSDSPLFQLSELMAHLPIKRGLSKYYEGKSESFTSLAGVIRIEDVAKNGRNQYRRKMMKASKSCGNGLDAHKPYTLPKPIISKKVSRSCVSSLAFPGSRRGGSFLTSTKPPPVPVQKKF